MTNLLERSRLQLKLDGERFQLGHRLTQTTSAELLNRHMKGDESRPRGVLCADVALLLDECACRSSPSLIMSFMSAEFFFSPQTKTTKTDRTKTTKTKTTTNEDQDKRPPPRPKTDRTKTEDRPNEDQDRPNEEQDQDRHKRRPRQTKTISSQISRSLISVVLCP